MSGFAQSYLGRLRAVVGSRLLLVPGMRIVIENPEGRILFQQRSDFGTWGLPGGVPDEGEHPNDTIVRETLEETGLEVLDAKPFGFACDPAHEVWTYPNGDQCHYYTLLYVARAYRGEPRVADNESLAVGWFEPDALPEVLPCMARTVEAYGRWKGTGEFQMI
jgi:ADP-ribose pyrophosphatase YjhB (NUDIX family)